MFELTLVTPQKKLLTGTEVEEVIVPAFMGELNILPGHAPLMTTLSTGIMKYRLKGESEFKKAALSWGYCEVNPKGVQVLAETAETPEEIDKARASRAYETSEKRLQEAGLTPDDHARALKKQHRAQVRLDLLD